MGHASVLHGPLPGFCSVTTDREGRAYVYICQDEEVHWVHILEVCFDHFSRIRLILFHSTRMVLQSCPFSQDLFKAFRFVVHAVVSMGRLTGESAEHCAKLKYRSSLR